MKILISIRAMLGNFLFYVRKIKFLSQQNYMFISVKNNGSRIGTCHEQLIRSEEKCQAYLELSCTKWTRRDSLEKVRHCQWRSQDLLVCRISAFENGSQLKLMEEYY